MKLKESFGYLIIAAAVIVVFMIWASVSPLTERFSNASSSLLNLGRISGLLGITLMSMTFLINTRAKFLEKIFGSLGKAYTAHKIAGAASFMLLLFHPVLLASSYMFASVGAASSLLVPGASLVNDLGTLALALLTLIIIYTLFIRIRYHRWKFVHKLTGLVLLFASLHAFMVSSDISASAPLRLYVGALVVVAFGSFFYRSLFSRLFVRRHSYIVDEVEAVKGHVTNIRFRPSGKAMKYKPGQFCYITFKANGFSREEHPFSISSHPGDPYVRLSIKPLGDFTSTLPGMYKGAGALIEGPFGNFSSERYPGRQIWIAGGIGVTPFLSMARGENKGAEIDLYYCVKDMGEAVFLDELNKASKGKKLKLIPHFSSEKGHINASMIKDAIGSHIFICGPPPMMKALKDGLLRLGVKKEMIHTEEFRML